MEAEVVIVANLVIAKLKEVVGFPLFKERPNVVSNCLASRLWQSAQFTFHVAQSILQMKGDPDIKTEIF